MKLGAYLHGKIDVFEGLILIFGCFHGTCVAGPFFGFSMHPSPLGWGRSNSEKTENHKNVKISPTSPFIAENERKSLFFGVFFMIFMWFFMWFFMIFMWFLGLNRLIFMWFLRIWTSDFMWFWWLKWWFWWYFKANRRFAWYRWKPLKITSKTIKIKWKSMKITLKLT